MIHAQQRVAQYMADLDNFRKVMTYRKAAGSHEIDLSDLGSRSRISAVPSNSCSPPDWVNCTPAVLQSAKDWWSQQRRNTRTKLLVAGHSEVGSTCRTRHFSIKSATVLAVVREPVCRTWISLCWNWHAPCRRFPC